MAEAPFVPLRPIPLKERSAILFLEYGQLDVLDGAFVLVDQNGTRMQIPVGGLACLMLEPGTRVSHAAVVLCARVGCLLIWVGEAGVRLYAAGQPGGARADLLLFQARTALDETARLNVVREMFRRRFGEEPPERRSVDQLRGMEGARVRAMYQLLAQRHGVTWKARRYDQEDWTGGDLPNRCLSAANACLYGLCEAAILAAGYAPAIGFLHRGKPQSFVYDVADLYKFETVVPAAFQVAARILKGKGGQEPPERQVRIACRDLFRRTGFLERVIPDIGAILAAGGLAAPEEAPEAAEPAIPPEESSGDDGHRG
ncbi:type I-E CRISPR-associated endonuclease Cas1e [Nitrospirillum sp. BR 11828]|uniref:type I-E CRISPR-associated endonuclease Cas1e n=1 Tax=Nitrospirillum sp. BR 11828 TaxID=3104325 RepID=UPI002ACA6F56|nr:type I-E CRISPR-associated endonuclease Cas1e [Nitrospirillum sp. BR 11828]MDZ5649986.1 type I-E CRISPR-associated endonuclease Cas1e [Nitrospirillum sp. BR 11828]